MANLENLSHIDFEELCRDLANAETGNRFEAFGPGPDGGIDGRHAKGRKSTVLQCKHYWRSTFSTLKSVLRNEVKKIEKIKPSRYLLFISQSLTPKKKEELAKIIGSFLQNPEDIWGREDIEDALRRNSEIEKSHIKLWLSSSAVLERILQSGLEAFTQATKDEILEELRVYVRNPSFDKATKRLEEQKILIVSGPPGVGKTTLARMIAYHYLNEGWRFYAINSLEDGFSKIDDGTPTIFFFDDFLGRIELDRQSLLQRDSALATFARRVRKSKNTRFILTTRAHIFEEARLISDYVDDKRIQLAKYILDVSTYTRKIRSHILFNHLSASNLSQEHFAALLDRDWLKKIVDHKNYNPRVIASVSSDCLDTVKADEYPAYVFHALENPDLIWSKPFKALDVRCRNLLICLFFGSEYGQEIEELRGNYADLHRAICEAYSQPSKPDDYEEALRILESGFISISNKNVRFVNPSVRDFLKAYLVDIQFLELLPHEARRADWAMHLWNHVKATFKTHPEILSRFTKAFKPFAKIIDVNPTMIRSEIRGFTSYSQDDLPLSARVDLLLEWWNHSKDETFFQAALDLSRSSHLMLVSWSDGQAIPGTHWWVSNFVDDDHLLKRELLVNLERRLIEVLESGIPTDELVSIVEKVNEYMADSIPDNVQAVLDSTIDYELEETEGAISHLDSEQSLSEQIDYLDSLAKLTGRDASTAKEIINEKLSELEETQWSEERPSFPSRPGSERENFNDDALRSLFSGLIDPQP
jgi:energy-coupling factor transporter ATP-binding protein EcfA2